MSIEALIAEERSSRSLSLSAIERYTRSELTSDIIWVGILEKDKIVFAHPSEGEMNIFMRADGYKFCFIEGNISSLPFVFMVNGYYGLCLYKSKARKGKTDVCYVMIVRRPAFNYYIPALVKFSEIEVDRIEWIQNFIQTVPVQEDARDSILKWGLPAVMTKLSNATLLVLLSALLLERSVIVLSSDLTLLSKVVLCTPFLLHPFTYQCSILPIVPASLADLLASPTPFISGYFKAGIEFTGSLHLPPNRNEIDPNTIWIDLDQTHPTFNATILTLPSWKELMVNIIPYRAPQSDLGVAVLASLFEDYFSELFNIEMVAPHRICKREQEVRTSIFLDTSFLNTIPLPHRPFYTQFLQTQIATQALTWILQELDR